MSDKSVLISTEKSSFSLQKTVLDQTLSACSNCFDIVPTKIVELNGKVFLEKECCEKEQVLLENDASFYKEAVLPFVFERDYLTIDKSRYGEDIYSRLNEESTVKMFNITSRCNMRCPICGAELNPLYFPRRDLSFEKIKKKLKREKSNLIIISGGEPTVREDLPKIIKAIIESGNTPELYTNGLKLADKDYVKKLKKAGLKIVCLSFDGFDDSIYVALRGRRLLKEKMKALKNLKEENMIVWLIPVIGRNVNEEQVKLITKFASLNSDFIRGIRFSPLYPRDESKINERQTVSDIIKLLEKDFPIEMKDFVESKKFYYNLYKLAGMFGKKIQKKISYLVQNNLYLKIQDNNIRTLFSTLKLKKINKLLGSIISEKNNLNSLKILIKNIKVILDKEIAKMGLTAIFHSLNLAKASTYNRKDILLIGIGGLNKATVEDLKRKFPAEAKGIFLEPKS